MLYAIGFDKIGVAISDLYFVDPNPQINEEGPEQGVRLEVRLFERQPLRGSKYSAQPIAIEEPIWRADLLESASNPGTLDRAHHHPRFRGWEPGRRHFVEEMSVDPVGWVGKRLEDLDGLLEEAGVSPDRVGPDDGNALRKAAPEIVAIIRSMLDRVQAGELAQPPDGDAPESARISWL